MFYHELDVWKISIEFVIDIYSVTRAFPKRRNLVWSDQIRRAPVSIPSNNAGGAARKSDKEFVNFIYITHGSAVEIETQLDDKNLFVTRVVLTPGNYIGTLESWEIPVDIVLVPEETYKWRIDMGA